MSRRHPSRISTEGGAPSVLFRENLDKMRCSDPTCTKEHEAVILYGRCHDKTPAWIRCVDNLLTLRCSKCDNRIATVCLEKDLTADLVESCHPTAPSWVGYDQKTGLLSVQCTKCDRRMVDVNVLWGAN